MISSRSRTWDSLNFSLGWKLLNPQLALPCTSPNMLWTTLKMLVYLVPNQYQLPWTTLLSCPKILDSHLMTFQAIDDSWVACFIWLTQGLAYHLQLANWASILIAQQISIMLLPSKFFDTLRLSLPVAFSFPPLLIYAWEATVILIGAHVQTLEDLSSSFASSSGPLRSLGKARSKSLFHVHHLRQSIERLLRPHVKHSGYYISYTIFSFLSSTCNLILWQPISSPYSLQSNVSWKDETHWNWLSHCAR